MGGPDDGEEVKPDPIEVLRTAAVQLHELFLSYMNAGFTEQQALYLCGKLVEGAGGQ